jgi:predicted ArsR family transcriptional regulator
MAKKPMTERQKEIKRLLDGGAEVGEIAELLHTSAQAIHNQMSRMRAAGYLPKAKRGGRRVAASASASAPTRDVAIPPPEVAARAASNGSRTVEEHLATELNGVITRLDEISNETAALAEEDGRLQSRRERLEAATKALAGTAA